jgi:hypothetical protein
MVVAYSMQETLKNGRNEDLRYVVWAWLFVFGAGAGSCERILYNAMDKLST